MNSNDNYDYDLFVIGGGSGGMSTAKAAAALGARVALADFVKPSTQGTTWGLGGTCVNAGCIPKKLMHFASILGELREDQKVFGFTDTTQRPHDWNDMLEKVNAHIKSLNWGYKTTLAEKGVKYINALASIASLNTIELTFKNKPKEIVTAKYILLATGGRPSLLNIPGAKEYCITSDDLFWRKTPPGECLVVGVGYIGMECSGFLRGMGYPTDILHRGEILRGFDIESIAKVVHYMKHVSKVNFVQGTPVSFEKEGDKIKTTWIDNASIVHSKLYDTVLMAVGRYPDIKSIGLEQLNVKVDNHGKLIVNEHYETSVAGVYAIGDIVSGGRELTPVAIKQGLHLAAGLFSGLWKSLDLRSIATTVFTPLEYASSGYTEEEAVAAFGQNNISVYSAEYMPVEWSLHHEKSQFKCLIKVIVNQTNDKILGIHFMGPNAGEILQGLSVSVRLGLSLSQLQDTVPLQDILGITLTNLKLRRHII